MLCKATEADLEQMVAFRRKTYGGTRQDALDWLCGIVGLDNILILARDPAPGAKPIPAAMIGAVPVECGHHHGVWLCCMATDPSLQGRAGQIFNQFTEVNPSIRCKIKQKFIIIKCILCLYQFHLQFVLVDLLIADTVRFLFFAPVFRLFFLILFGCHPDDGL